MNAQGPDMQCVNSFNVPLALVKVPYDATERRFPIQFITKAFPRLNLFDYRTGHFGTETLQQLSSKTFRH